MSDPLILAPHTDHPRHFHENRYVYPVLSRRSRGISVGINLNPDKICNFDCIYCQVDRRSESETQFVDITQVIVELETTLDLVESGRLYDDDRFRDVPAPLRRLNDLAFSGDGEPTSFRNIEEIVTAVATVKARRALVDVKLVMITNASLFHRPHVRAALAVLDRNNGETWAKLDAGTAEYYHLIERTTIPFERILANLREASHVRPLVIQSLFLTLDGVGPSDTEILAYCDRLLDLLASGGKIDRIQLYTVARRPAEAAVGALAPAQVDAIAEIVRTRVDRPVEAYYGTSH